MYNIGVGAGKYLSDYLWSEVASFCHFLKNMMEIIFKMIKIIIIYHLTFSCEKWQIMENRQK